MTKKPNATTQKFIEIENITNDIVFLKGGGACVILEVMSTNFALLSREEQDSRIISYAALLNSLPFPIQIFIRTKKLDISSYVKLLDQQANTTTNEILVERIKLYRGFVAELVKVNTVLEKSFYIVVPYSYLEKAVMGIKSKEFSSDATQSLHLKAKSLHDQLTRLNLRAKTLEKEELVSLFYEIYNGTSVDPTQIIENYKMPIVEGGKAQ